MSKPAKLANAKSKNASGGVPFIVLVGIFGLALLGYVFSQMFLPVEAHPSHWLVALMGASPRWRSRLVVVPLAWRYHLSDYVRKHSEFALVGC